MLIDRMTIAITEKGEKMRYIDADALIDNLNRFAPEHFNALINQLILKQPTADVKPVVSGKWRKIDKLGRIVKCSKCGNTLALYGVNTGRGDANFCPNCGADMRGKKDDKGRSDTAT